MSSTDAAADNLWCELLEFGAGWLATRAEDLTNTCLRLQDLPVVGGYGWVGPDQIDGEKALRGRLLIDAAGANLIRKPKIEIGFVDASFDLKNSEVSIEAKVGFGARNLNLSDGNIERIRTHPGDWWLLVIGYGNPDQTYDWSAHLRRVWDSSRYKLDGSAARARPCSLLCNGKAETRSAVALVARLEPA